MHTGLYSLACPPAVRAHVDAMMAALDIPALVVAGTADPWSNAEVTAEIVASLKRPEQVLLDDCGHLPNLEAEAQFNEALLAFLNRTRPGK